MNEQSPSAPGPAGAAASGGLAPRDAVELELRRVGTRLAALGPVRLERQGQDGVRPADHVRALLQWLADEGADLEGRPRRPVPELAPHALADQLVVLTADVLAALPAAPDDSTTLPAVHDRLVALRRAL